jgi:hypothetical protein
MDPTTFFDDFCAGAGAMTAVCTSSCDLQDLVIAPIARAAMTAGRPVFSLSASHDRSRLGVASTSAASGSFSSPRSARVVFDAAEPEAERAVKLRLACDLLDLAPTLSPRPVIIVDDAADLIRIRTLCPQLIGTFASAANRGISIVTAFKQLSGQRFPIPGLIVRERPDASRWIDHASHLWLGPNLIEADVRMVSEHYGLLDSPAEADYHRPCILGRREQGKRPTNWEISLVDSWDLALVQDHPARAVGR